MVPEPLPQMFPFRQTGQGQKFGAGTSSADRGPTPGQAGLVGVPPCKSTHLDRPGIAGGSNL
jgi:hypothetical protein